MSAGPIKVLVFGEAGRALVQREFSVEQMRRRYDALYACLTARRGSGRRFDVAA